MTNPLHEANRVRWDAASEGWARSADTRGLWNRCHRQPGLVLHPRELEHLGDINGKAVCVLGSGDNQVVFALAGMGASVTSVDISENQLAVASKRAALLGLDIAFVRSDVTDLAALADGQFDLVYTGGHVAVWVSDLDKFYSEASRILKVGGRLIVSEYHPFRRVWRETAAALELECGYFARGPHAYDAAADIFHHSAGPLKSFEFHWTVSDYIQAVMKSPCRLLTVDEFGDQAEGWETAPLKGLPQVLLIVGLKG